MDVNNEQGEKLGHVKVGDTKLEALQRLSWLGPGGLIDKNGFGLLDNEKIDENNGPYVFKATQSQQQQQPDDTMATLTVEYFKKNYASLKDVGDEELKGVLEKLNRNWVKNSDQLAAITRDTLIQNEFPGLFVDAVKPAEEPDTQPQTQQQRQQQQTTQPQFRQLLQKCNLTPSESVMAVILKQFASSAAFVDSPEQARDLYLNAALLPRSATRVVLGEKGISVADVFRGSDPSKAVLLHAHENGLPRILKIATDKSICHEWDVFSAVSSSSHDEDTFLVNVKLLKFESAEIELGDYSGGHSNHPPIRCGLLMKHFQGTLSQCKIPLVSEILLRYGKCLRKALSTLHKAGFCHLDVKPSNIFLFEDACYLGDYGAAVNTGDPIHERTTKYYPTDGDFVAKEETDMYLLAVTLLEMFGTIPQASGRNALSKEEIHEKIASVGTDEVRIFLTSLFDGALESCSASQSDILCGR